MSFFDRMRVFCSENSFMARSEPVHHDECVKKEEYSLLKEEIFCLSRTINSLKSQLKMLRRFQSRKNNKTEK